MAIYLFTSLTKNLNSGRPRTNLPSVQPGGGEILPYKGLIGTYGQPGYVFLDFCLKQGIFSETGAHNPVLRRSTDCAYILQMS